MYIARGACYLQVPSWGCIIVTLLYCWQFYIRELKGLVSNETEVLLPWGRATQKFGLINLITEFILVIMCIGHRNDRNDDKNKSFTV